MTADSGDFLVSAEGSLEAALSGDVTEIVIRERDLGQGAETLDDLVGALRHEAARYDRLLAGGWDLDSPVREGVGRCVRDGDATGGTGAGAGNGFDPRSGLRGVLDGAMSLAEAAHVVRAAADAYAGFAREGWTLSEPVRDARVELARRR